jgi:dTDP-glucose 4,6-dehydratase
MSEEHPCAPDPASAYSSGKFAAEWIARAYAKKFKLNVAIARCYAFVGPFLPLDRQFAIGNFIRSVMDDQPVLINGNGTPIRSYLYSADLAVWLITLLLRVEGLDVVNVGGDEAVTIHELAERVIRVLGSDSPIYLAEVPQSSTVGTRYVPDISRITERYGLKPTVSLDLAIFRTAQWHISRSK